MSLGIWDGGAVRATHQSLGVTRVSQMDSSGELTEDGANHATHVAGTMIANGTADVSVKGIAPKGLLLAHNWANDYTEMTTRAQEGMLVSNHSYGASYGLAGFHNNSTDLGRYNDEARVVDMLMYSAPYYLAVYAAGNDRNGGPSSGGGWVHFNTTKGGYDLLHGPAVGKNPVVVAAVQGFMDYTSANDVVMSNFSNWGPTDDFRIKPDISAKGVSVLSTTAVDDVSTASFNGTSMAAPSVTAVFALWQQYYRQLWPIRMQMRAATLKALMAHTASEAGDAEGPDAKFGWGVIDARKGAQVMKEAKDNEGSKLRELTLNSGNVYEEVVHVDGTTILTATISWTDPAGSVKSGEDNSSPALVNDLDLRIIRPNGNEVLPFALNKDFNNLYTMRADNNVDVIEKTYYKSVISGLTPAGTYTIRVSHKGSALSGGSQNFSLVISGLQGSGASVDKHYFKDLSVYPNPATDFINIEGTMDTMSGAAVSIYDLTGKLVMKNSSLFERSSSAQMDISSLSQGVYMLKIDNHGQSTVQKVVKK